MHQTESSAVKHFVLAIVLALSTAGALQAQAPGSSSRIRINQVGYHPGAPKVAVVVEEVGDALDAFYVTTSGGADTVFTGALGIPRTWPLSMETVRQADFSALREPGRYRVVVPGVGASFAFDIAPYVYQDLTRGTIRGFYYQRASTALAPEHAGAWARPAGHPDTNVLVHPSAASPGRPAGTVIAAPRGWYDAGDYNKYVVNSGITTATLLSLYEHFPAYFDRLDLGIPESGDAVPDLLDEILWNLRWMLAMQDPADGGVYHKLTTPDFEGMKTTPQQARQQRYVVQKSTAATLDFAAVTAQAARIFAGFEAELPGLADSLRAASIAAWRWARQHPAVYYDQGRMNSPFDPDVNTGAYGDGNVTDEFLWAATELYVTTKADSFLANYDPFAVRDLDVPSWSDVAALGFYSLLHHADDLTPAATITSIERELIQLADGLVETRRNSAYGVAMGGAPSDFVWGSNAVAANQGMVLLQAFRLSRDSLYLDAALANLDYLLGRNAIGISFVTGYGSAAPVYPHHRPSASDTVRNPVPGLLVGGAQPGPAGPGGLPPVPDHVSSSHLVPRSRVQLRIQRDRDQLERADGLPRRGRGSTALRDRPAGCVDGPGRAPAARRRIRDPHLPQPRSHRRHRFVLRR